jgi:sugar phosphate isomerase/epimerase
MDFGTVTHAVGHHLSFEETLATIKSVGFDSVLLLTSRDAAPVGADGTCPNAFPNVLESDPEHVLRATRNAGIEVGALHFSGKIDLESDEGVLASTAAMNEYAAYAVAIGCKNLTHPVPSCGRTRVATEEKATEIKRLASCMSAVASAFEDRELQVSVDTHHRSWVEGLEDCRLLLDSITSPNAGILLNIGHMASAESYGWLLVDEYPDRIPVVGWKDHSLAPDRPKPMWSIELGTGHTPFELYIKAFKAHPADRVNLINCENVPDEERVDVLKRSLAYMEELWDAAR